MYFPKDITTNGSISNPVLVMLRVRGRFEADTTSMKTTPCKLLGAIDTDEKREVVDRDEGRVALRGGDGVFALRAEYSVGECSLSMAIGISVIESMMLLSV